MTIEEMNAVTRDLPTKSAKIRALDSHGATKTEIAGFLGIRYQHVYNVLLAEKPRQATGQAQSLQDYITRLAVGSSGQITLPKDLLTRMGVPKGGELFVRQASDGMRLMTRDDAIAHVQTVVARRAPEEAALIALLFGKQEIDDG